MLRFKISFVEEIISFGPHLDIITDSMVNVDLESLITLIFKKKKN